MRAAVERRADRARQRLREMDSISLRMIKVQSSIGRAEEQLQTKTAAAEQAERERQQAQLRRDQLVEDMRLLSEERADQSGGVWTVEDSVDLVASQFVHWGHREPQESASPTVAAQVPQLSEMVREMQRHFAEVVGSAGDAAGRGWQETWQETECQSLDSGQVAHSTLAEATRGHNAATTLIHAAAQTCDHTAGMEVPGLIPGTDLRPGDVLTSVLGNAYTAGPGWSPCWATMALISPSPPRRNISHTTLTVFFCALSVNPSRANATLSRLKSCSRGCTPALHWRLGNGALCRFARAGLSWASLCSWTQTSSPLLVAPRKRGTAHRRIVDSGEFEDLGTGEGA